MHQIRLFPFMVAVAMSLACSSTPTATSDASPSPEAVDAAVTPADAAVTPADAAPDAGPLEACLPPAGPAPSLGPRNDLVAAAGPLAGGSVDTIAITPDSATVVFIADTETVGVKRLYTVPVAGGAITRLSHNDQASPGQDVEDFAITPDGQRVIFRGDVDQPNRFQLYSVAISGGAVTTLSDASFQVFGQNLTITPDGAWLVFTAQHDAPVLHTLLHSVPVAGGTINTLSHQGGSSSQDVQSFHASADSLRVVFAGDTEVENRERIYSVAITGGAITSLLPDGSTPLTRIYSEFALTNDSESVIFVAEPSPGAPDQLYRGSLVDGTVTLLLEEVDGTPFSDIFDPEVGSGDYLFFSGNLAGSTKSDFFSVSLLDGSSELLTKGIGRNSRNRNQHISPDGLYAFFAGTSPEGVLRIYSTLMAGGPLVTLSQNIYETVDRATYFPLVTADSRRVVYSGNPDPDGVNRFYAVCIQGGAEPQRLTPNDEPNTDLGASFADAKLSADGRFALIKGAFLYSNVEQLFVSDMLTGAILTVDSNVNDPALSVDEFLISPDGAWIVFTGDQLFDGVRRLHSRQLLKQPRSTGSSATIENTRPLVIRASSGSSWLVRLQQRRRHRRGTNLLDRERPVSRCTSASSCPRTTHGHRSRRRVATAPV